MIINMIAYQTLQTQLKDDTEMKDEKIIITNETVQILQEETDVEHAGETVEMSLLGGSKETKTWQHKGLYKYVKQKKLKTV